MKIACLDHLVLTVTNRDRSCEFYARVLGMEVMEHLKKCGVDLISDPS
jgi:catechol 2,3-dioxygenase-like lactoylglutathione lyase family enzyme